MTQRGRGGARPANRRSGGGRGPQDADETRQPAAPRIDLVAARSRVRAVIEPVVLAAGFDLEDVNLSRAGRRHVVRVLVDADGGISLDDVAVVSREISQALDTVEETQGEVLAGEYQLEVGSPGVDRPLTLPRHWRRNIGRLVTVTAGPAGGTDEITGRITGVDDAGVALAVEARGKPGAKKRPPTPRHVPWAQLGAGRVQVEFGRADDAAGEIVDDADADTENDVSQSRGGGQ